MSRRRVLTNWIWPMDVKNTGPSVYMCECVCAVSSTHHQGWRQHRVTPTWLQQPAAYCNCTLICMDTSKQHVWIIYPNFFFYHNHASCSTFMSGGFRFFSFSVPSYVTLCNIKDCLVSSNNSGWLLQIKMISLSVSVIVAFSVFPRFLKGACI